MNNILCIETSGKICSVALTDGEKAIGYAYSKESNQHTAQVLQLIDEVLIESSLKKSDLNAIAVNIGPGSYTGLRIGLSTAKGLCFALNIPLITINALESIAIHAKEKSDQSYARIVSMIDAGKGNAYTAQYDLDLDKIILSEFMEIVSIKRKDDILFCGSIEVEKRNLFALFIPVFLDAKHLIKIASRKHKQSDYSDIAYSTPSYIKEYQVFKSKKGIVRKKHF